MMDEIVQVPDGHRLAIRALSADRSGDHGRWPQQGRWTEPVANPVLCKRGWHACLDTLQVVRGGWFGEMLWLVELAGDVIVGDDKVAAERARLLQPLPWDERAARLWACDVAEHVLPIFERECPSDDRPRRAIELARAFAHGGEVSAAAMADARDAALDTTTAAASYAAWAAASDVALAAADAAITAKTAAKSAAKAAVWAAVWNSVWNAGRAAARDAERRWQAHHLAVVLGLDGTILDGGGR